MNKQPVFPYTEREAQKAGVSYSSEENRNRPFPRRLAQLRAEAGLSQQQLADLLEVSKSTISLYEVGDTVPDAKMIVKLCGVFHVSTDYLLCQSDYRDAAVQQLTVSDIGLTEKSAKMIQNLRHFIPGPFPYSFTNVLNGLCEDDRFLSLLRDISFCCKLVSDPAPDPEDEPIDNDTIVEARDVLSSIGEFPLPVDDAADFYLQQACEKLKAIVRSYSAKDRDNNL